MVAWLAIGTGAAGASPAPTEPSDDGFVRIFDGRTLDGWDVQWLEKEPVPPRIEVRDGVMAIAPPRGWARYTGRQVTDFVLELEGRYLTEGANSGIFFRAHKGEYGPWVNPGWEVNFHHGTAAPGTGQANLELYGPRGKLPLAPAVYAKPIRNSAVGEWAPFRITVQGRRLRVDYLGQTDCVVFDDLTLGAGYIGLQAEKGSFEFRHIRLKTLDAARVDGPDPGTLAEDGAPTP